MALVSLSVYGPPQDTITPHLSLSLNSYLITLYLTLKGLIQTTFSHNFYPLTFTMYEDAEAFARSCSHYYVIDIRRCQNAINNGTTCLPAQRQRVRYPQEDHDRKCKSCDGQSPPDSPWYRYVNIFPLYSTSQSLQITTVEGLAREQEPD